MGTGRAMPVTKQEKLRAMYGRRLKSGVAEWCFELSNRELAEAVRKESGNLVRMLAWHLVEEYPLLELFDIVEWKRTRVRR